MNEPQAPESYKPCPISGQVRKDDALGVAYNDDFDGAPPSDEETQLTSDFK